jgi:hypothetical protein
MKWSMNREKWIISKEIPIYASEILQFLHAKIILLVLGTTWAKIPKDISP